MRRVLTVAAVALVFAAGAAAQTVIRWPSTRVLMSRAVLDVNHQPTPLTAHYIADEWNGVTVCSRVLYHDSGQFAVQEMPAAFCNPIH